MRKPRDESKALGPDSQGRERLLGEDGYVHVRLEWGHPMAHVNGWAREHRVVVAEHLGRRLLPQEVVHHLDEDRTNNELSNLELKPAGLHTGEHNHRKGTGSATCGRGHEWRIYPSGRRRCRICENAADRSRYDVNKN